MPPKGYRKYQTAIPGEAPAEGQGEEDTVQDTEFADAPEDLRAQLIALQAENTRLRLAAEGSKSGFASPNSKYAHIDSRTASEEELAAVKAEINAPVLLADGWLIP